MASWARIGRGADWTNAGQWDELAARDMLQELGQMREVLSSGGRLELELELPKPSVSQLELSPA